MVSPEKAATKPDGGFQFISVAQLCMVWWAYREGSIQLKDLRVWFAAHELLARRCQIKPGQKAVYTYDELQGLVSRGGDVSLSLQALQAHGLLSWDFGTVSFPSLIPCGQEWFGLETMLAQIPNRYRRVPVPRRLLRFIASGCRRVTLATVLGHLLRCLYYRNGQCKAEGFCKASWIAQVFGVSLRNVKAARQYLEGIGLLQRTEVPQWLRNRYGQKIAINLHWVNPCSAVPAQCAAVESPPPSPPSTLELTPPDSYRELPPGLKHQEPAIGGPTGILHTLFQQAREALREGTALLTDLEPKVMNHIPVSLQQKHRLADTKESSPLPPPTLRHILLEDLQDTGRLLDLYAQAIQIELIGSSEAERLAFIGLAQHVLAYRPENAGGMFHQLLTRRRFHFVTQEDEDGAQQRLKQHLYATGGHHLTLQLDQVGQIS
jgi:hypothetical protein